MYADNGDLTAKAIFDRGTNAQQAVFPPYLVGYGSDHKTALAGFQKADQADPFILSFIAQTYEKLGDDAHAKEFYTKARVRRRTRRRPPSRPLAKSKIE